MSVTLSKKNLLTAEGLTNAAIADSKLIDEMVECTVLVRNKTITIPYNL